MVACSVRFDVRCLLCAVRGALCVVRRVLSVVC